MDEAYETARRLLTEHMNELHKVATVLMEREKISGDEFRTLMEGGNLPPYDLAKGETSKEAEEPQVTPGQTVAQENDTKAETAAEPDTDRPDAQE